VCASWTRRWQLLGRTCLGHGSAQWHFQNRTLRDTQGTIDAGAVVFTLNRRVDGALHDDLQITSFAQRPVQLRLIVQLDGDFSDVFQVKDSSTPSRLRSLRLLRDDGFTLRYERDGLVRALHLRIAPKQPMTLVGRAFNSISRSSMASAGTAASRLRPRSSSASFRMQARWRARCRPSRRR